MACSSLSCLAWSSLQSGGGGGNLASEGEASCMDCYLRSPSLFARQAYGRPEPSGQWCHLKHEHVILLECGGAQPCSVPPRVVIVAVLLLFHGKSSHSLAQPPARGEAYWDLSTW